MAQPEVGLTIFACQHDARSRSATTHDPAPAVCWNTLPSAEISSISLCILFAAIVFPAAGLFRRFWMCRVLAAGRFRGFCMCRGLSSAMVHHPIVHHPHHEWFGLSCQGFVSQGPSVHHLSLAVSVVITGLQEMRKCGTLILNFSHEMNPFYQLPVVGRCLLGTGNSFGNWVRSSVVPFGGVRKNI